MKIIRRALSAAAFSLILSGPAYPHTQLSSSTPADESVLEASPSEIVLSFSEAVRLTALVIEHDAETSSLEVAVANAAKAFTVDLPELAPGDYVVRWRALSEDTHVISGEIRFSIAA